MGGTDSCWFLILGLFSCIHVNESWPLRPHGVQICFTLPTCVFCGVSADNFALGLLTRNDKPCDEIWKSLKRLEKIASLWELLLVSSKLASKSNTRSLPVNVWESAKFILWTRMFEQIQTKVKKKDKRRKIWNIINSEMGGIFPSQIKWLGAMTGCLIVFRVQPQENRKYWFQRDQSFISWSPNSILYWDIETFCTLVMFLWWSCFQNSKH